MILNEIIARKNTDLENGLFRIPLSELERKAFARPEPRDFRQALAAPGLSVIAEVKRASPSKGMMTGSFNYQKTAAAYEKGGASAISVLTERNYFLGEDYYLTQIKEKAGIPVLRKDFIIDERQVLESRALGADAILLIAAVLDDKAMLRLFALAGECGLHCLFEAHDGEEVKRIAACGAKMIGINNRNLQTFAIDLGTFERLLPLIPSEAFAVAESGISSPREAQRLRKAGADAVLIGEMLMRSDNPASLIKACREET
ncbi:MAG: Indole-3-glycerol phosphate synthase [Candidatus Dichloromethanomonas elyunquensis]|nr:MAG: Indole-3-glycerol phosphate synthase [Candidatus Dichloromethanomonas elyunquensis]